MKQVKTILVAIALLIGISMPQATKAQQQDQLHINIVGRWINESSDKYIWEYYADGTKIHKNGSGYKYTVEGTDITYPVKDFIFHWTWKIEGNVLTEMQDPKIDYHLGDISYYPADIQKKIKEDIESRIKNWDNNETWRFEILSYSPEVMTLKKGESEYTYLRDMSNMSAQEKAEYNKEIAKWNKIKKEKEQKDYLAALERDNLQMAKLKVKAIASGNQYDYWIIGHMYEFGKGNDGMTTTICLDSALVWYKKAAAIDPKNEEYVTAVKYKIKTGREDYYEQKEKKEEKATYDELCRKFGKKYVDAVVNHQVIVGMPEALMVASFDARLVGQSGNRKTYRIYDYGARERIDGSIHVSKQHQMTVWVSGGKVTSLRKWE